MNTEKRNFGRYFTTFNPFTLNPFKEWLNIATVRDSELKVLEPFAGKNHIVAAMNEAFPTVEAEWSCFDITPGISLVPGVSIVTEDTLKNFPSGYNVAITNPPYLAKNSATRRGLAFPETDYDDVYQLALKKMLENCSYVAAIIPESFITQGLFFERLITVISLTTDMFEETECPTCLALFVPTEVKRALYVDEGDFTVYRMDERIGGFLELKTCIYFPDTGYKIKFNDGEGEIGGRFADNNKCESICFVPGEDINPERIKVTSRTVTRISGFPLESKKQRDLLIRRANEILSEYRSMTGDVFLTAFKGLREDGAFRRRLDFKTARGILSKAFLDLDKI